MEQPWSTCLFLPSAASYLPSPFTKFFGRWWSWAFWRVNHIRTEAHELLDGLGVGGDEVGEGHGDGDVHPELGDLEDPLGRPQRRHGRGLHPLSLPFPLSNLRNLSSGGNGDDTHTVDRGVPCSRFGGDFCA